MKATILDKGNLMAEIRNSGEPLFFGALLRPEVLQVHHEETCTLGYFFQKS